MKKFLFMFLFAAAVASAFTFVVAEEGAGGDKKFVIHGEIRQRADFNDNFTDFTEDSDDSFLFFPYRARIGAEGHFGKGVIGYVEFQNFGRWGDTLPTKGGFGPVFGDNETNPFSFTGDRFNTTVDAENNFENNVKLYEAWIALTKIRGTNFSLKFGRQEIVKGTEMLLGDNDFYNGTSHDGAMAGWAWDNFDLDVWWTRPFQTPFGVFFNPPNHQSVNFYGAWAQWAKFESGADVAAYALLYDDGSTDTIPPSARRSFWTIGGRTGRDITGRNAFNWNAELAIQRGDQTIGPGLGDTKDIKASALEGMLQYNLHSGSLDQRFQVVAATATGDDDGGATTDAETFDPLFQDSHARYGWSDIFTLSNLTAFSLGYNVHYRDHWFGGDVWNFKLAEEDPATTEDDLGQEVDFWWKYQYSPNTQVTFAGVWFSPGDAIDAALSPVNTDSGIRLVGNLRLRF